MIREFDKELTYFWAFALTVLTLVDQTAKEKGFTLPERSLRYSKWSTRCSDG